MILACQKLLGQITKVLGLRRTLPPPVWEKLPKNPVFFFWEAPLLWQPLSGGAHWRVEGWTPNPRTSQTPPHPSAPLSGQLRQPEKYKSTKRWHKIWRKIRQKRGLTSPLWLTILFSEWMIVLTELTLDAVDLHDNKHHWCHWWWQQLLHLW